MYSYQASPGSPKYHKAKEKDRPLFDSYSSYGFLSYESRPLPINHISYTKLLKLRGEAGHTKFINPAYLDLVEDKIGFQQRKNL
jgi:anaerobic magnesium-protoporphyrin IX monomethyl ester cyclase